MERLVVQNTPELMTKRLVLRRFTDADMADFYKIFSDETVNTFLPWFPVKDMDEAREFFQRRYARIYAQGRGLAYAVCLKEVNRPIGYVGVDVDAPYDLGYGLLPQFWGQGITSEAVAAVMAQAKASGIPYLTATHDVKNPRSGAVMQRLGMHYAYSYEEQWQPKDFPVIFRLYQLNFVSASDDFYMGYWNQSTRHFCEEL